jgi:hypothetical protein
VSSPLARESISKRGQGKADALLSDRLAPLWNTILSPKLTVSTPGFEGSTRCSGGAFSCDPTAPWPIFTSSCRLVSTGLTSISIAFASVRRTTSCHGFGGLACHDARKIKLADLHFRINERFLYEYDFGDLWQHQVRIEKRLEIETSRSYPVCVGGQWAGPPEDCGGPQAFLDRRASAPWRVRELLDDLLEDIKVGDTEALDYRLEELQPWQEWIMLHRFDRRRVNRRLRQYAEGAPESMNSRGGWQR